MRGKNKRELYKPWGDKSPTTEADWARFHAISTADKAKIERMVQHDPQVSEMAKALEAMVPGLGPRGSSEVLTILGLWLVDQEIGEPRV